MVHLLDQLVTVSARRYPTREALRCGDQSLTYEQFEDAVNRVAAGLSELGVTRRDRVAIYLPKTIEAVLAMFAAARLGAVFVPINPVLKGPQAVHILQDCGARLLISSSRRLATVLEQQAELPLTDVVLTDATEAMRHPCPVTPWRRLLDPCAAAAASSAIDADVVSILYTSGSTGRPKGVVLSHRNMVSGALSVAGYLSNDCEDRLLAVLPLSFDAGFSQLSTAFSVGACAVLLEHRLPMDIPRLVAEQRITGLTAVPPLWIQVADLDWPDAARSALRYFANTGGRMPRATLQSLRRALPHAEPFLMYGLTEAFRSTYLPPAEIDRRPDSIGKAIPNAEVLVLRPDGSPCDADEPGELVHRGALVAQGYWNNAQATAARFKPLPRAADGVPLPELAVFSGDIVRRDADGYLYFVERADEMIKTSGYRVSPTEVEEIVHASGLVSEVVALGVPHPQLGQAIVAVAVPKSGAETAGETLLGYCRRNLPNFMVPLQFVWRQQIPRNQNGKFDRKGLRAEYQELFLS